MKKVVKKKAPEPEEDLLGGFGVDAGAGDGEPPDETGLLREGERRFDERFSHRNDRRTF